jgi:hypothetical protein
MPVVTEKPRQLKGLRAQLAARLARLAGRQSGVLREGAGTNKIGHFRVHVGVPRAQRAPDEASQHMPRLCCEYGNVARLLRPAFGDDAPMPGAGFALQLLLQRKQLEAGEYRNEGRRIAIEMRVPGFLGPVTDKGVGAMSFSPPLRSRAKPPARNEDVRALGRVGIFYTRQFLEFNVKFLIVLDFGCGSSRSERKKPPEIFTPPLERGLGYPLRH